MIVIDSTESIQNAIRILLTNNIYSAPLYDSNEEKYLGFIDLVDLVTFIVTTVEATSSSSENTQERLIHHHDKLEFINKTQQGDLKDLAKKNPFISIEKGSCFIDALFLFCETRTRRMAIVDFDTDTVTNILTQSAVVSWLSKHVKLLPFAHDTVQDLKLGFKKVLTVDSTSNAIDAFKLMANNRITSVGLTDTEGKLVSVLSVKDIKVLNMANPFKLLFHSAIKYVQSVRESEVQESIPTIHCTPKNTLIDILTRISSLRIHRMFVVDENIRPVGIISLGDILQVTLDHRNSKMNEDEEKE